jgi:hypothetical protein
MTKTELKKTAAAYVRDEQGRLDRADTATARRAIAEDIRAFLDSTGALVMSDAQTRKLHKIRDKALNS